MVQMVYKDGSPFLRPVLLILYGHSSHITINVTEFAKSNGILFTLLAVSHLPHSTTIGGWCFQALQEFFLKACCKYMANNPSHVVTEDVLASLVGSAISQSHTPLNIMGVLKKQGYTHFNPGAVSDRQLVLSKALKRPPLKLDCFLNNNSHYSSNDFKRDMISLILHIWNGDAKTTPRVFPQQILDLTTDSGFVVTGMMGGTASTATHLQ